MTNNNISLICLIVILLLAGISNPQTIHDVTVANFSFTPPTLTITVGDTVRWTNVLGNHNVVADDNSFTSGPVAPAPWVYAHVFTSAGNNPYYCALHGGPGGQGMSGVIIVQNPVGVPEDELTVAKFKLQQNYPNPFNPITMIKYQVPEISLVTIKVYDVLGKEMETLINEEKPAGTFEVEFNGGVLSSGIYFYRIKAGDFVETKKMVLMK
jgi:plastocyanin